MPLIIESQLPPGGEYKAMPMDGVLISVAKPEASPAARNAHGPRSRRILIADDSSEIRESIAIVVTRAGFKTETVQDGEEAWRAICDKGFDLVITDHQMPRMTGLNLIRKVREASIDAPCILISAALPESESTLMPLIRPGAVLAKPFKFETLVKVVHSLLDQGATQGIPEP
jgi:DNA-binding response OmpR family regulator